MNAGEVIAAITSGEPITSVAKRYGVSRQAVSYCARNATGMGVVELRGYRAVSPARTNRDDILAAYIAGDDYRDIIKRFQISTTTLYTIVRESGASRKAARQRERARHVPDVQALLDRGASLVSAADELGLPRPLVATMYNAGEVTTFHTRHEKRFPEITPQSLSEAVTHAGTIAEIAASFGCSRTLIRNKLHEYGIPRPPRGKRSTKQ